MIKLYGIPVIQIQEKDFPAKIPKLEYLTYEDHQEPKYIASFLQVVNGEGETIALFFLNLGIKNEGFTDGLEFARYYDEMNSESYQWWLMEEDDWKIWEEMYETSDRDEIMEAYSEGPSSSGSFDDYHDYGSATIFLICYGRLRYPFGLEKGPRSNYEWSLKQIWDFMYYEVDDLLSDPDVISKKKVVDLINIAMDSRDFCGELFHNMIERVFDSGVKSIEPIAERIFTKENIDLYIEEANTGQRTEILAYLLEYKNKHFPATNAPPTL